MSKVSSDWLVICCARLSAYKDYTIRQKHNS